MMESGGASGAAACGVRSSESYLRKCLETQTIDYLLSKPCCFNLLAVGEDGLGKVTLLETLFGVKAAGLRDAKSRAVADQSAREFASAQIVSETLTVGPDCCGGADGLTGSQQRLTVRLMTTVNWSLGDLGGRTPWTAVAEFLAKQVSHYLNSRAASPFDFRPEDDERVHCCLFFLPPTGGRGLRRCDALALKFLEDKVNLVPLLAKADCYTADELADRKTAVAADLQRHGISVHQFLLPMAQLQQQQQQQQQQQLMQLSAAAPLFGQRILAAPMAVIGAPHPELVRSLPWGSVNVEDEKFSDVPALRSLVLEKNMLILRKSTKKFHSAIQKSKMAATLPRK